MNKKLIVGLGNYPKEYENTRHNVGFKIIDKLTSSLNCDLSHEMFNGIFGKKIINNNEYFIAKPLTYMNLSGEFVSKLTNYLKIDITDIVVICDDINLSVGEIRIRKSGSSGGQNGLKNIIGCLNSENFIRIRIGIGKPSNTKMNLADYVLSKFTKEESTLINQTIDKTCQILIDYCENNDIDALMNKYN